MSDGRVPSDDVIAQISESYEDLDENDLRVAAGYGPKLDKMDPVKAVEFALRGEEHPGRGQEADHRVRPADAEKYTPRKTRMARLRFEDEAELFAHKAWETLKLEPPVDLGRVAAALGIEVCEREFVPRDRRPLSRLPDAPPVIAINNLYTKPPAASDSPSRTRSAITCWVIARPDSGRSSSIPRKMRRSSSSSAPATGSRRSC